MRGETEEEVKERLRKPCLVNVLRAANETDGTKASSKVIERLLASGDHFRVTL
jgi:hypothetical protein